MNGVFVDSNILLDVLGDDEPWAPWSIASLEAAANRARLVINPIVYAEVSAGYIHIEDVENALPPFLEREPIPYEAAFLAGKAFVAYRRRGGLRHAPLSDFFIGAHAVVAAYALLTRDPQLYRTYFPSLQLIAP